jgi:hypothetical protein
VSGVTGVTPVHWLVVDVEGPVANIEKTLHVTMGVYQHPTENRTFYARTGAHAWSGNSLLQISGLDNFTLPQAKNTKRSQAPGGASETTGSGPNGHFIGGNMRAAYHIESPFTHKLVQNVGLDEPTANRKALSNFMLDLPHQRIASMNLDRTVSAGSAQTYG